MFSPGIEPGTFCVLDRCDNRYTTKTHWHLRIIQPWHAQPGSLVAECARPNITRNPIAVLSRDRLVVRTLRCGRSNPGSNPGLGNSDIFFFRLFKKSLNSVVLLFKNVCLIYLFFCIRIELDTYYFCIGKCLKVRSQCCLFSLTTIAKNVVKIAVGQKNLKKCRPKQTHEISFMNFFWIFSIKINKFTLISNSKIQIKIKIWPAVTQNKKLLRWC